MKQLLLIPVCLLVACLSPVTEARDAGACRESLGSAAAYGELLRARKPGEVRGGSYLFGAGLLIDARTFKRAEGSGLGEAVWPCSGTAGASWWHQPQLSYIKITLEKNDRAYTLLYPYSEQLQAEINAACAADGGFGPTSVLLALTPDPAPGVFGRAAAIAQADGGFLACSAGVDDAGVAREMILSRTDDGALIASVPSSVGHCIQLRPPLALASGLDGRQELINFETRSLVTLPGVCNFTQEGALLCAPANVVLLLSGQNSIEIRREEGAGFFPLDATLRGRQFVSRSTADGGFGWFWYRDGGLTLLDEGMPLSTIGDFDDHNVFYVVSKPLLDGGMNVEFERRCLPN